MNFRAIVAGSIAFGVLAALLWVVIWSVAFPDVWNGYDDHTVRVFIFSSVGYVVANLVSTLRG